jgi:ATP-dependent DNA helicase RecG
VMVIEDANRFGLAQLHQLRGRVGRGEHEGHCFLITEERYNPREPVESPLLFDEDVPAGPKADPQADTDSGRRRLAILEESSDGFRIAEEDFRIRGVGVYFGTAQHGRSRLRLADLHRDLPLVQEARDAAFALVSRDPELRLPEHALLRQRIQDMHIEYDIQEDYTAVA